MGVSINFRFDDRDYAPVFNDSSTFYKNYIYLLFTNYDKPVDTFFVMGGLLVTSSLLNALDRCVTFIVTIWALIIIPTHTHIQEKCQHSTNVSASIFTIYAITGADHSIPCLIYQVYGLRTVF